MDPRSGDRLWSDDDEPGRDGGRRPPRDGNAPAERSSKAGGARPDRSTGDGPSGARPARSGGEPGAPPAAGFPPFAAPGAPSSRFTAPRHPRGPSADVVAARPELVLAGWWRRAVAASIDALIIALVAVAVLVALGVGFFSADSEAEAIAIGALSLVAFAVVVVVTLAYAPVMMWRTDGRTVGRMVAGTRVVRADGRPMSLGVATVREVVLKAMVFGLLSQATFGLAGLADVLWPLIDRENRALHDFGVDTRTVLN